MRQAEVTVEGDDDIQDGESAFIICNHRSWSDFYAIHYLAERKNMLPRCRYFAKDSLKYIPFFGQNLSNRS